MEKWMFICLLLCLFGFLKELRPSEPFLTEYLVGPWKNLTVEQVVQQVYPVWTYSYLALLVAVFLLTDYLRYKPVVVLEGLSFMATWCTLLWGFGVQQMQVVEFLYATGTATQIAYFTYIYAKVPHEHFQVVTGYTQAALLAGRCIAGILGQVLISANLCDYYTLNFISLSTVTSATVVACLLPNVSRSIYFHQNNKKKDENETKEDIPSDLYVEDNTPKKVSSIHTAYHLLWVDFSSSYSNPYLLKWSLWWAFASCGYFQVLNYIQPLWEAVAAEDGSTIYNGAVEALHTFLSALLAVGIGYTPLNWSVLGQPLIGIISIFEGVMLYLAGTAQYLWVTYVAYMMFNMTYSILITIASSEVAKGLKQESYGLIFGINTFLALLFQTILTVVVADDVGLRLSPKDQFVVYGGYYFVLGGAFMIMSAYDAGRRRG